MKTLKIMLLAGFTFLLIGSAGCQKKDSPEKSTPSGEMKMAEGWSVKTGEETAVREALERMKKGLGGTPPKLVAVFTTGGQYDLQKVSKHLKASLGPDVKVWGLNSDLKGVAAGGAIRPGLSVMGFHSPSLAVGVGTAAFDWQDPASCRKAGQKAIEGALRDAGKSKKDPPQIILFAGLNLVNETEVLAGIADRVGSVPMWGGNAGQEKPDDQPGVGWTLSGDDARKDQVSVAALWMESKVGVAYGYGYEETPKFKGVVTKADVPKRLVQEIDHRPAADVYNEWTGGKLTRIIQTGGGSIPLEIGGKYGFKKPVQNVPAGYVWIGGPILTPDKAIFMAHESVTVGTELTLLKLSRREYFENKPAVIAAIARDRGEIPEEDIAGSLFLYCYAIIYAAAGQQYDFTKAFSLLTKSLYGTTYTGFLAGGEIGFSPQGGNRILAGSTVIAVFGKH